MHAFDVLSDPVRRRILELLVDGEEPAGEITAVITSEYGISQPAVSQHLRVLREQGFATVRPEGTRRLYAVDPTGLQQASEWLSPRPSARSLPADGVSADWLLPRPARTTSMIPTPSQRTRSNPWLTSPLR